MVEILELISVATGYELLQIVNFTTFHILKFILLNLFTSNISFYTSLQKFC